MADYSKRNGGFLAKALTASGTAVFDYGRWDTQESGNNSLRPLRRVEEIPHRRDHGFRLFQRAAVAGAGNRDKARSPNARSQAR